MLMNSISSHESPKVASALQRLGAKTARGFIALFCAVASQGLLAEPPKVFTLVPGASSDAYFEINVSGTVFVTIAAPPGQEPCAEFWWIKWPLGTVESLGRKCGNLRLETPGLSRFAMSAKLRAGGAKSVIKIAISANETPDHPQKFDF
jgi:hypothetical protein